LSQSLFWLHVIPAKTTRVLAAKSFEADEEDAGEVPIFWDCPKTGPRPVTTILLQIGNRPNRAYSGRLH
jgi:hypothetical protein